MEDLRWRVVCGPRRRRSFKPRIVSPEHRRSDWKVLDLFPILAKV